MDSSLSFGQNLRRIRLARGLTTAQLADKTLISCSSIQRYEHDVCTPPFDMLIKLAFALEVRLNDLYDFSGETYRANLHNYTF